MTPEPIKIWAFHDAPKQLRDLSGNGGDEDWLAVLPEGHAELPLWMEEGTAFGCFAVDIHNMDNGSMVAIGSHS